MSRNDKDSFADALHALSAGNDQETDEAIIEETPLESEAVISEPTPAPVTPTPIAPAPVATAPVAPTRSVSPMASATPQPTPAAKQRPTRPSAPGITAPQKPTSPTSPTSPTPTPTPSAPARPSRPAAPAPIATPAPVDYARKTVRKSASKPKFKAGSLQVRQTLIPPCLVAGGMFLLMGIAFFLQPSTFALRQISLYFPLGIGIMGAVVLALGIFNIILVKKELDRKKPTA